MSTTTLSLSSAEPDRPRRRRRRSPEPTPERLAEAAALFEGLADDTTEFGRLMRRLAASARLLADAAEHGESGMVLHLPQRRRRGRQA